MKVNREKRLMVKFLEERGWKILNKDTERDEEGEYTYTEEKKKYCHRLCNRG